MNEGRGGAETGGNVRKHPEPSSERLCVGAVYHLPMTVLRRKLSSPPHLAEKNL
jgi:hypothetical protein